MVWTSRTFARNFRWLFSIRLYELLWRWRTCLLLNGLLLSVISSWWRASMSCGSAPWRCWHSSCLWGWFCCFFSLVVVVTCSWVDAQFESGWSKDSSCPQWHWLVCFCGWFWLFCGWTVLVFCCSFRVRCSSCVVDRWMKWIGFSFSARLTDWRLAGSSGGGQWDPPWWNFCTPARIFYRQWWPVSAWNRSRPILAQNQIQTPLHSADRTLWTYRNYCADSARPRDNRLSSYPRNASSLRIYFAWLYTGRSDWTAAHFRLIPTRTMKSLSSAHSTTWWSCWWLLSLWTLCPSKDQTCKSTSERDAYFVRSGEAVCGKCMSYACTHSRKCCTSCCGRVDLNRVRSSTSCWRKSVSSWFQKGADGRSAKVTSICDWDLRQSRRIWSCRRLRRQRWS